MCSMSVPVTLHEFLLLSVNFNEDHDCMTLYVRSLAYPEGRLGGFNPHWIFKKICIVCLQNILSYVH